MNSLLRVTRFRRERFVVLHVRTTVNERAAVRLTWAEALKLAAVLLAMVYGTLIEWWVDIGGADHEDSGV